MKTLYQLCNDLRSRINSEYLWQHDSKTLHANINAYIDSIMLTKTGKRRYPLYYREVLNQVTYQLYIVIENTLVIFGYWYKDQFYTTHKEIKEYSNTNKLHKLNLIQTEWDKMPRGLYYRSNLKPYFIC